MLKLIDHVLYVELCRGGRGENLVADSRLQNENYTRQSHQSFFCIILSLWSDFSCPGDELACCFVSKVREDAGYHPIEKYLRAKPRLCRLCIFCYNSDLLLLLRKGRKRKNSPSVYILTVFVHCLFVHLLFRVMTMRETMCIGSPTGAPDLLEETLDVMVLCDCYPNSMQDDFGYASSVFLQTSACPT